MDIIYPNERIGIFIDGANLNATARTLGFEIDFRRLRTIFTGKGRLVRAFFYTALPDNDEHSRLRPLIDWLNYNGFTIVTKPTKEFVDAAGRRKTKGNMDIELAIDLMEMTPYLDHVLLFSGDGDFRRLVEAVQRKGVRVSAVSTARTQPPMIADELRRQADNFIELQDFVGKIGREGAAREGGPPQRPSYGGSPRRDFAMDDDLDTIEYKNPPQGGRP